MEVDFCRSCGQAISKDFAFCPHCGVQTKRGELFSDLLDKALAPLEAKQPGLVLDQLDRLTVRLDRLDHDLEEFLQYVEVKNPLQR